MKTWLRGRAWIWGVLLLACATGGAPSAERPDAGKKTEPLVLRLLQREERTGAPPGLEEELERWEPALLEEQLELSLYRGSQRLLTFRTGELALAAGLHLNYLHLLSPSTIVELIETQSWAQFALEPASAEMAVNFALDGGLLFWAGRSVLVNAGRLLRHIAKPVGAPSG